MLTYTRLRDGHTQDNTSTASLCLTKNRCAEADLLREHFLRALYEFKENGKFLAILSEVSNTFSSQELWLNHVALRPKRDPSAMQRIT